MAVSGLEMKSQCTSQCTMLHGGRFLLEEITGEVYAPDEKGHMRLEPYTATRLLGYDNYKKAYIGAFADNQNTCFFGGAAMRGTTESCGWHARRERCILRV